MAFRCVSYARVFANSFKDCHSLSLNGRRCYAATSQGAAAAGRSAAVDQVSKAADAAAIKEESSAHPSWVPDPVTGDYKPSDRAADIDPADLRQKFFNHKIKTPR